MKKIRLMFVIVVLISLVGCSKSEKKIDFYKGEPSLYMMSGTEGGKAYAVFMEDTVAMAYGSKTMIFEYVLGDNEITLTHNGEVKTLILQIGEEFDGIEARDPDNNNDLVYTFFSVRQECGKRKDDTISDGGEYTFITSDSGVADIIISDGKFKVNQNGQTLMNPDFSVDGNIMKLSEKNSDEILLLRVEILDSYDFILYDVNNEQNFVILHMESASGVRCPN